MMDLEQAPLRKEFDVDRPVKKVLRAIHTNDEVSSIKDQAEIVDLGKLERLEGIRNHVLENGIGSQIFQDFLGSLPSLEELSISDGLEYIDLKSLLSYHGSTLQTLHLHETETTNPQKPRRTLSHDDLRLIRDSCPHLYDLGIDISYIRGDPQESEIYAVLSTFRNIFSLTLNYDLGIGLPSSTSRETNDQCDMIRRQVNTLIDRQSTATKLEAIWAEVVGPRLKEMLVQVGEHNRDEEKIS
ncbi:hypothetical protein K435DRAFT_880803 [Dendrothele bispora CBS 962.96]|uniref:RNI-like protein n=1 Tax=Dendrothele bispora (strain CBS 962.96) TaxID=1314807 RepID=A0A4S8KK18_DENBC|nr:hypothetical protein K435DRAFT_880803 [Dendrothele bispora CBS 962.96]